MCSPTERNKGLSPLHSAGISLKHEASLQVRTEQGKDFPRSHSKSVAKDIQILVSQCSCSNSLNSCGQLPEGMSWSILFTRHIPRDYNRV